MTIIHKFKRCCAQKSEAGEIRKKEFAENKGINRLFDVMLLLRNLHPSTLPRQGNKGY